jgi:hypothetical protein
LEAVKRFAQVSVIRDDVAALAVRPHKALHLCGVMNGEVA